MQQNKGGTEGLEEEQRGSHQSGFHKHSSDRWTSTCLVESVSWDQKSLNEALDWFLCMCNTNNSLLKDQRSSSTVHHTLETLAPNILPASWINDFTPRCQTAPQWARLYFCHLNFGAHFHANWKFIVTNHVTLAVTPYLNEYQVWLYFPAANAH